MNEPVKIAECLKRGENAVAFTKGCSMQPLLYEGKTHVILKPLDRRLRCGDLPIYLRPDGIYVIHRLMKEKNGYCYLLGDHNIKTEVIPKEWVLGYVTMIYRKGRYFSVDDVFYSFYKWFWICTTPVRIICKKLRYRCYGVLRKKRKTANGEEQQYDKTTDEQKN